MARRFDTVLVANRGEIAVRIIRACREAGLRSIQVHSSADADTAAVRMADEAICIGGPKPADSYLNIPALIEVARRSGAGAVHPGYGFLAENAEFAEAVHREAMVYVGPQPEIIRMMGDKALARRCAQRAGVPVIPGSEGVVRSMEDAVSLASDIGYPVLIKAAAGGGGRGMRVAQTEEELCEKWSGAMSEAQTAFGSADVYLEKFLDRVRHIEVQIIGDGDQVIHLGDRDCSIQRRHQKLLEEGPASVLDPALQEAMRQAATRLAQSLGYRNAGTVEFVVDMDTHQFYFIEMNTRIQVEHPVTEVLTGIDLVKMQFQIAAGLPLGIQQHDVRLQGHAIELRINAENPAKAFIPSAGQVTEFVMPSGPGVRVDTYAYPGYELPPFYDSLLAKIIVWGRDREEAIARVKRALRETHIAGVATTVSFHEKLLEEAAFLENTTHTRFIKEHMYAKHPMRNLL